jgi:hypothetical protein
MGKVRNRFGLLVLIGIVGLGGCYERVVSSNGIGSNAADVQGGYRSNTAADRAFDSLSQTPKPSSRSQRWVDPGSREPGSK